MSFKKFILKSSFRKKSRTLYQLLGITLPILIILFFAINIQTTQGLNEKFIPNDDIDIAGSENNITHFSLPIRESLIDELKKDNRIENVVGLTSGRCDIDGINGTVMGVNSSDTDFMKMMLSNGRKFNDNEKEVVLSNDIAAKLNKTVGEYVFIENNTYKIVGVTIKTSENDNKFYTSLKNVQEFETLDNLPMDYKQGSVGEILIQTKEGVNNIEFTKDLKNQYINETIIGPTEEGEKEYNYQELVNKIIFIFVPMIIGILLTLIIMMKSVGDRTREIGVLKAIGWKSRRIFAMVMSETFIISIVSFIFASIIAILITFAIFLMSPFYRIDFFTFLGTLSFKTFLNTFMIVVVMALLGALLPAIRASRLSPAEAVKEE
ncbi:MAG: FtsX-like permease family protein [Methanobacterium sp.]